MERTANTQSKQSTNTDQVSNYGHSRPNAEMAGELGLGPEMTFGEAAREVLAYHFTRLLAAEAGTIEGQDPEPLHDMRVATRRLRAALRDFSSAYDKEQLAPLADDVRWLGAQLGRIRDLDVLLEWLSAYEESVPPEQRPYVHRVVADRRAAHVRERAALLTSLDSARYREFKDKFQAMVYENLAQDAETPVLTKAVEKIERELRRVHRRGRGINRNQLARLHRLRIECKRLRYTAEFFASLFPNCLDQFVKQVTRLQDTLGQVHDRNVYAEFVQELCRLESADPEMDAALDQMIAVLKQEQDVAYDRFKKAYRRFDSRKYRIKVDRQLRRAQQPD